MQLAAGLVLGNTWQERIIPGLQVTIIGMTVVFAVLILLYGILVLVGRFGGGEGAPRRKDRSEDSPPAEPKVLATESEPPTAAVADQAVAETPEGDLVAVIAAAVAASMADGQVVHARRPAPAVPAKLGWTLAGRMELLTAREQLPRG